MTDHTEQVWRVLLFVLFGPDAADQLGRPHSSGDGEGSKRIKNTTNYYDADFNLTSRPSSAHL